MTITNPVQSAFFHTAATTNTQLIRLAPNAPPSRGPTRRMGRPWTVEEHNFFLQGLEMYPSGPWKRIADHIGTRTTRQTMTHAQKYRQKIARWKNYIGGAMIVPSMSPASIDLTYDGQLACERAATDWQALEQAMLAEQRDSDLFDGDLAELLENYEPLQLVEDLEAASMTSWPSDCHSI